MESVVGVPECIGNEQRNVRQRLYGSMDAEPKGDQRQEHSSTSKSEKAVRQMASPLSKVAAGNPFFIVTEKGAWGSVMGGVDSSSLFDEAKRCWEEHRASGKMHHEPPWRLCSLVDDNREHPYYLRWLDTMELPSLEELLQKDLSSRVATSTGSQNGAATTKKGIIESECVAK